MAGPSSTAGPQSLWPEQSLVHGLIDLTDNEPSVSRKNSKNRYKRKFSKLVDTTLSNERQITRFETEQREFRAKAQAETCNPLDQIQEFEHVERALRLEIAALEKQFEAQRQGLLQVNKSLREEVMHLKRQRIMCSICRSGAVNSATKCGHLFCLSCLEGWELPWRESIDSWGHTEEHLQGILKCPTCRKWIVLADVKRLYPES